MRREVILTGEPIDEAALISRRELPPGMGAVVCFTGAVRGSEAGEPISAIEYEAFERMAIHQFNLLLDQLAVRWPLASVRLVHRTGVVRAGEASVWAEIMAPHRAEAFEACQWLMTEMKRVVPIWKKAIPQ